ncbi:hypothetical protein AGLY_015354 [Aphis glycines]|uniref:Uncharacterized protein n=1 Tax=Aphis glycines TaxID=307491 RepID=A0A6G0T1T9_APHGL|nr:hypothetical protein AGLY_015354 [Aphis glycines]
MIVNKMVLQTDSGVMKNTRYLSAITAVPVRKKIFNKIVQTNVYIKINNGLKSIANILRNLQDSRLTLTGMSEKSEIPVGQININSITLMNKECILFSWQYNYELRSCIQKYDRLKKINTIYNCHKVGTNKFVNNHFIRILIFSCTFIFMISRVACFITFQDCFVHPQQFYFYLIHSDYLHHRIPSPQLLVPRLLCNLTYALQIHILLPKLVVPIGHSNIFSISSSQAKSTKGSSHTTTSLRFTCIGDKLYQIGYILFLKKNMKYFLSFLVLLEKQLNVELLYRYEKHVECQYDYIIFYNSSTLDKLDSALK